MASPEPAPAQAAQAEPEIAPDLSLLDDADSVLDGQSLNESTASITSSLLEYRTIHGRTYQASNTTEYWAPNDDKHIEAFDVAHQWLTMMLGDKLYEAPIGDSPKRILDVGTGTGIWAIDMADKFPGAEVIGVDISPIQPNWVPPNLHFQIDDVQLPWTFEPESFDFIHIRYMHGAIADWPKLYDEVFKALKPGGWVQQIEPNIELRTTNPERPMADDHVFKQWHRLFYDVGDKIGREFRFSDKNMLEYANGAGFTDVNYKKFSIPLSPWPKDKRLKELGLYAGLYLALSLDGFAMFPVGEILGWSIEEVQVLVANMRSTLKDPRNRNMSDMHMVMAQKPMTSAPSAAPAPAPAPAPAAAPAAPAAEP